MANLIAIGPREQDIAYTNGLFSGSITLYGSNRNDNISYCCARNKRINHNITTEDQSDFINQEMMKKISENPDVRFMSYDPNLAYLCDDEIIRRTICLNEKPVMDKMNNKITFRAWAEKLCKVHHSEVFAGNECTYEKLSSYWGVRSDFIVQAVMASGGEGTFVLTSENSVDTEPLFQKDEKYLVSIYENYNIPVNIHAVIYEDEVLLLPASIQIMRRHYNKLLYHGADFAAVGQIQEQALRDFCGCVQSLCSQLQREGYRGITGVDGMIVDGSVRILEMNNRFQGSTLLINRALSEAGIQSLHEMNYDAFNRADSGLNLDGFEVPYSCFTYLTDSNGEIPSGSMRQFEIEPAFAGLFDDGLCRDVPIAPFASLERVIFNTNIVGVNSNKDIDLHPNIIGLSDEWHHEIIRKKSLTHLKFALINQGVVITPEAEKYLVEIGGIRKGVYNAVDVYLNDMPINSAVSVKLVGLSPFSLNLVNGHLKLCVLGNPHMDAMIHHEDAIGLQQVKSGVKVGDICLLATDRVRVQHARNCRYKRREVGCNFCEVDNFEFSFEEADIFEALDLYISSDCEFRHFLVGGRSGESADESDEILHIVNYIRSKGNWPIYVMCVPPDDLSVLRRFYEAGVTELAMNIEIWNQHLAKKWMPGKGFIPRDYYIKALAYAAELWGRNGSVRSSFIVGLESEKTLLEGVEQVCRAGAAPILSVFRPIPKTKGENIIPPDNDKLLDIFQKVKEICIPYGLTPGPTCVHCQNNTLSMPETPTEK